MIIVLVASEDPGLAGNLDSLKAQLAACEARLFAVAITRVFERTYSFPVVTAQFLNQLAKDSGGRVFRGAWHASREVRRKKGMPLTVEHTYDAPGAHRVAVQIAGAGGEERRIELTWDAGG